MSLKRKLPSACDLAWKRVKVHSPQLPSGAVAQHGARSRALSSPAQLLTRSFQMCKGPPVNTALRALRRESFERKQREKGVEIGMMTSEDQLAHGVREEEMLRELRKGLVFKAQPIRRYAAGSRTARVSRSLTVPKAPRLRTALRAEYYNLSHLS